MANAGANKLVLRPTAELDILAAYLKNKWELTVQQAEAFHDQLATSYSNSTRDDVLDDILRYTTFNPDDLEKIVQESMERTRGASDTQVAVLVTTKLIILRAAGRPSRKAIPIDPMLKSLAWRVNMTNYASAALAKKLLTDLSNMSSKRASLFPAFLFESLLKSIEAGLETEWFCDRLGLRGGLEQRPQQAQSTPAGVAETPQGKPAGEAQGVEQADGDQQQHAQTPAPAPAPAPVPATTLKGSTVTSDTDDAESGGEEEAEGEGKVTQPPKPKHKRKTSTPEAQVAHTLGPSFEGSVAYGLDSPRRRSQRKKK